MSLTGDHISFHVDSAQLTVTDEEKTLLKSFQDWYNRLQLVSTAREVEKAGKPLQDHVDPEVSDTSCTANAFFIANRFATRRSSFPPGTFRFMQLPPELRCRVYTYVFANERNWESGLQLAELRFPGITRVSKNIRKEALPQFCAEAPILIPVYANLDQRSWDRWKASTGQEVPDEHTPFPDCGTLHLKNKTKRIIQAMKEVARFNNLSFIVCDQWRSSYTKKGVPTGELLSTLHLKVEKKKLKVDVEKGDKVRYMEERDDDGRKLYQLPDYYAAMSDSRTTIDQIGARPNFEGFYLKDIRQIASAFRY